MKQFIVNSMKLGKGSSALNHRWGNHLLDHKKISCREIFGSKEKRKVVYFGLPFFIISNHLCVFFNCLTGYKTLSFFFLTALLVTQTLNFFFFNCLTGYTNPELFFSTALLVSQTLSFFFQLPYRLHKP